jgi:hypothetical protein
MSRGSANPGQHRPTLGAGILGVLRKAGQAVLEAFESTPPSSAEWYIAGEILGAVPVWSKEPDGSQTHVPQ